MAKLMENCSAAMGDNDKHPGASRSSAATVTAAAAATAAFPASARYAPAACWGAWATPPGAADVQRRLSRSRTPAGSLSPLLPLGGRLFHRLGGGWRGLKQEEVANPIGAFRALNSLAQRREGPVLLATSPAEKGAGGEAPGDDIWRDSALRYAGYANEVGESFRNVLPKLVVPSYAVSIAYVCGDTVDKAYKEYSNGKGATAAGKMGLDVLLWQSLASVAVPGLTINLTVKAVSAAMAGEQAKRLLSKVARKWMPTAVGLGIIPFIVTPIDEAVTWAMDESVRKWLGTETADTGKH